SDLGSFATYAIFTNWLYRGTRHHFSRLSEHINAANPFFSRQFKMISGAFKSHIGDLYSAQRQALQLLAHKTELQAMLVTLRDITCIIGVLSVLAALLVLFIRRLQMYKVTLKNHYRIIPW